MDPLERDKYLQKELKASLEKELEDIKHLKLSELCDGKGIVWERAGFFGHLYIIGETDDGTVLLDFDKDIYDSAKHPRKSPNCLRDALQAYDRIKKYLEENGEEHESAYYMDRIGFYFRQGIPCLT